MTDQQIRIAVAEVMGHVEPACYGNLGWLSKAGHGKVEFVPDYPTDLNACHEMEKVLTTDEQWETYQGYLLRDPTNFPCSRFAALIHPTARQRCEAFLRVIGKWQENQP